MATFKKDFGAFELQEKIGAGGMASVYLAMQKSLDRKCVLKILHAHLAEDEKLVQRFEREARAVAALRHPNIVQVFDCGRQDDVSYIAMEFVEGRDLEKWLKEAGAPPMEVALLMLHDLFSGLEHAHQHRIVHRDIKPANLMLTPEGVIKIMDFGLARREEENTAVTVVGTVLGTPAYMSPEQATGETAEERSDIFSSGVVAYELLGGRRPFLGETYSNVLRAILTVEPPSVGELNPLIPAPLVTLVMRMLQKDVTRRTPSFAQARADLDAIMQELGLPRGRDLLREYAQDPAALAERLRKKRLARHIDQGVFYENMGMVKLEDALREFQCALHLDPENKTARQHLKKLENEREKMLIEQSSGSGLSPDRTMVLPSSPVAPPARPAQPVRPAPAPAPRPAPPPARPAPAAPKRQQREQARNPMAGLLVGLAVVVVVILGLLGVYLKFGRAPEPATNAVDIAPPVQAPVQPPAPVTPAAPQTSLTLQAEPADARITLDGAAVLPGMQNAITPGEHAVKIEKKGFVTQERSVTVREGIPNNFTFALAAAGAPAVGTETTPGGTGHLTVRVQPYATLFVDDKQAGRAGAVTNTVDLAPGFYTIRAEHPAYAPKIWTKVRIAPGTSSTLSYDFLAQSHGSLKVLSPAGWAYIRLNGRDTGKTTPFTFNDLDPGHYVVELVRQGFVVDGGPRGVDLKGGEVTPMEFTIHQGP